MGDPGIEVEPDTLYGQVEEFINACAAEQIRSASEICKSLIF